MPLTLEPEIELGFREALQEAYARGRSSVKANKAKRVVKAFDESKVKRDGDGKFSFTTTGSVTGEKLEHEAYVNEFDGKFYVHSQDEYGGNQYMSLPHPTRESADKRLAEHIHASSGGQHDEPGDGNFADGEAEFHTVGNDGSIIKHTMKIEEKGGKYRFIAHDEHGGETTVGKWGTRASAEDIGGRIVRVTHGTNIDEDEDDEPDELTDDDIDPDAVKPTGGDLDSEAQTYKIYGDSTDAYEPVTMSVRAQHGTYTAEDGEEYDVWRRITEHPDNPGEVDDAGEWTFDEDAAMAEVDDAVSNGEDHPGAPTEVPSNVKGGEVEPIEGLTYTDADGDTLGVGIEEGTFRHAGEEYAAYRYSTDDGTEGDWQLSAEDATADAEEFVENYDAGESSEDDDEDEPSQDELDDMPDAEPVNKSMDRLRKRWEIVRKSVDSSGHEHKGKGVGGGQFTGTGEGGGAELPKGESRKAGRVREIAEAASKIGVTDDKISGDTIDRNDLDAIESQLTPREKQKLDRYLESQAEESVEGWNPDIDVDDVAANEGWNDDDIRDKAKSLIADLGEEFVENIGDAAESEIDDWYSGTTKKGEEAVAELIERLEGDDDYKPLVDKLQYLRDDAQREIEEAVESASQKEIESKIEDYDSSSDREYWLQDYWDEHLFDHEGEQVLDHWGVDSDGDAAYAFETSNGGKYNIELWNEGSSDIVPEIVFKDSESQFAITGAGGAHEVFGKVAPACTALITKKKLPAVQFSAAEPSRAKLYRRLVQTISATAPEYAAVSVPHGDTGERYFVVLRDKLSEYMGKLNPAQAAKVTHLVKSLGKGKLPAGVEIIEPATDEEIEHWNTPEGWEDEESESADLPIDADVKNYVDSLFKEKAFNRRLMFLRKAWDAAQAAMHPRGDDGKFISKSEIEAAKKSPAKAEKLRKETTDPDQRAKLDAALEEPESEVKPHEMTKAEHKKAVDNHAVELLKDKKKYKGTRGVDAAIADAQAKHGEHGKHVADAVARGERLHPAVAADYPEHAGSGKDVKSRVQDWLDSQEQTSPKSSAEITQEQHAAASAKTSEASKKLFSHSHEWEKTKPWNMTAEQIKNGDAPGFSLGSYGDRGQEVAHYEDGKIVLSPKFFDSTYQKIENEDVRRAIIYHEVGHELSDSMLNDGTAFQLKDSGAMRGELNGQTTPGEQLSEAYSLMHSDPAYLKKNSPDIIPAVVARANALGMPVPKEFKGYGNGQGSQSGNGKLDAVRGDNTGPGGDSGSRSKPGRLLNVGLPTEVSKDAGGRVKDDSVRGLHGDDSGLDDFSFDAPASAYADPRLNLPATPLRQTQDQKEAAAERGNALHNQNAANLRDKHDDTYRGLSAAIGSTHNEDDAIFRHNAELAAERKTIAELKANAPEGHSAERTTALLRGLAGKSDAKRPEHLRKIQHALMHHSHKELKEIREKLGIRASGTKAEIGEKLAARAAKTDRSNRQHYTGPTMTVDEAHEALKNFDHSAPGASVKLANILSKQLTGKQLVELKKKLGVKASGSKWEAAHKIARRAVPKPEPVPQVDPKADIVAALESNENAWKAGEPGNLTPAVASHARAELARIGTEEHRAANPREPMHHSGGTWTKVGDNWHVKVPHADARPQDTVDVTTKAGTKKTVRLGDTVPHGNGTHSIGAVGSEPAPEKESSTKPTTVVDIPPSVGDTTGVDSQPANPKPGGGKMGQIEQLTAAHESLVASGASDRAQRFLGQYLSGAENEGQHTGGHKDIDYAKRTLPREDEHAVVTALRTAGYPVQKSMTEIWADVAAIKAATEKHKINVAIEPDHDRRVVWIKTNNPKTGTRTVKEVADTSEKGILGAVNSLFEEAGIKDAKSRSLAATWKWMHT